MNLLFVALAVSIDGMLVGLALGLRQVRIPLRMLIVIAIITFLCVFATMSLTRIIFYNQADDLAGWIGGLLLIGVGLLSLRPDKKEESNQRLCRLPEAAAVGFGVAVDASVASAALALDGVSPFLGALLMAAAHLALVALGNVAGRKGVVLQGWATRAIPAFILFVLGILRLPFVPI